MATVTKREAVVPAGAFCFGCHQSFEGNPVGLVFDTDLLSEGHRSELKGLYFHPGHLLRYSRSREWHELSEFLQKAGPSSY
jgi:hypothetical protein